MSSDIFNWRILYISNFHVVGIHINYLEKPYNLASTIFWITWIDEINSFHQILHHEQKEKA